MVSNIIGFSRPVQITTGGLYLVNLAKSYIADDNTQTTCQSCDSSCHFII